MKYDFEKVKESLKSQGEVDDKNIKLMLKILNQDLVPEPTLLKGCPIFRLDNGSLVAVWAKVGLALRQYKNAKDAGCAWLYKFTPNENLDLIAEILLDSSKSSVLIPSNLHYYDKPKGILIKYFYESELTQALISAYNICVAEQNLLKNKCQELLERYRTFYTKEPEPDTKEADAISKLEYFIELGYYDFETLISAMNYIFEKIRAAEMEADALYGPGDDDYNERGEWRDDGKYYPDWLGGMESEQDFWEH